MSVKMRKLWMCFLVCCGVIHMVNPQSVRLVRLVDHTGYAISVIQKTMSRGEEMHWCNFQTDDMSFSVRENIIGNNISAEIDLTDGFISSIHKIDIIPQTIQQVWLPVRNTTTVEVRATVRLLNVAIGFDVTTKLGEEIKHTTGLIIYPEIQFLFTITKHLFTDEITVDVVGNLIRTTNRIQFLPENDVTKVFTVLFDWNRIATSVARWASDVFKPIALQLVTKEIEFPRICYNCPVQ